MPTLKDRLGNLGLLDKMAVPSEVDALLSTLQVQAQDSLPGGADEGKVTFGVSDRLLGVFDLELTPPTGVRTYVLTLYGTPSAPNGFRLAVSLNAGAVQSWSPEPSHLRRARSI